MANYGRSVLEGFFARKQLENSVGLIAWGHRARMRVGLEVARRFAGKRALDYGSGDGTFLGLWAGSDHPPALGVGAELDPRVVDDCNKRFAEYPALRFVNMREIDGPEHQGRYDVVTCMEVLEHVVDLDRIIGQLRGLIAPGGALVVSVPVETGLPLLVKQAARKFAGWRGDAGYASYPPYSLREYAASLLARDEQHIERPVHDDGRQPFHDHKGFNWMALRKRLARDFDIEAQFGSPVEALPPHLGSQAWFIARKRG